MLPGRRKPSTEIHLWSRSRRKPGLQAALPAQQWRAAALPAALQGPLCSGKALLIRASSVESKTPCLAKIFLETAGAHAPLHQRPYSFSTVVSVPAPVLLPSQESLTMKGVHHHSRTHFLMLVLMPEHLGEMHVMLPESFALAAWRHFKRRGKQSLCGPGLCGGWKRGELF